MGSARTAATLAPACLLLSLGCARGGGPGVTSEFGDASVVFTSGIKCPQVVSAELLPAREVVTHPGTASSSENIFFTSVLFDRFNSYCGACHVQQVSGGLQVNLANFAQQITQARIDARLKQDDPGVFMPPPNAGGKAWSARLADANDPVVELVRLLELWIAQGSPVGQFRLAPPAGDGGAPDAGATAADPEATPAAPGPFADYSLSPAVGERLTNIGTCVPSPYIVGANGQTMDQLDLAFAQATELPDTLAETDLVSFDSETLARAGVISYFPVYPLWSDGSGKMRHVRTPRNQPIVFDKERQELQIPPNTRFYKTFFKRITEASGHVAYRKIETRLIVARPDTTAPDGTVQHSALFGTYLWDDAETRAVLLKDPLQDGKPFTDRVVPYVVDEPRALAIQATNPPNLAYALDIENPGVRRHYAVPGRERCIQCHMGSPTGSFVLGFTPLQIASVPPGASGVIEPATADQITQLQRLVSYRVIAGIADPGDVLPLERSQLPRTPRNAYELQAQAYLLGNCAHCHNPRGFPSSKAPELKEVLNFLPGPSGGIFQFPLDRASPVRARGLSHETPIPYITPSLRDVPDGTSTKKYVRCDPDPTVNPDNGWCTKSGQTKEYNDYIDAPWRSLIYRNVDTPFDYVDDYTIFPHMPMNTAGYDCRVTQILGDWMVSIPSVNSSVLPDDDLTPQPFVEVFPGDPGYAAAASAAQKRLATYHAGRRYAYCPDTVDTQDAAVLSGQRQTPDDTGIYDHSATPERLIMPVEGVPDRPHWVVTDLTDPPGAWLPRGAGWEGALVDHIADASGSGATTADVQTVIDALVGIRLDAPGVRDALLTPVPFAVWKQKPGCDFTGVPTAGAFQGDARPAWMDYAAVDPTAPVYLQSAGAAVFSNICINCHGPQADAKGLLADEISIMTGGNARVANFRSGLFGPAESPGANRVRIFSPDPTDAHAPPAGTGSADDYGARYLAWMALGGTKKQIPPNLLQIVATTPVAGIARRRTDGRASPNMLQLAQQLCSNVLLSTPNVSSAALGQLPGSFPVGWTSASSLISENGDAELWLKVCSLNNRPVVRVLQPTMGGSPTSWASATGLLISGTSLYWGDGAGDGGAPVFPPDAPVLDQRGRLRAGLGADNLFPMCVQQPSQPAERAAADAFLAGHPVQDPRSGASVVVPYCPAALFAAAAPSGGGSPPKFLLSVSRDASGNAVFADANRWALRGAINAGLAVFLYVDQLARGAITPQAPYNQCELRRN